jgi:hypothetical protein
MYDMPLVLTNLINQYVQSPEQDAFQQAQAQAPAPPPQLTENDMLEMYGVALDPGPAPQAAANADAAAAADAADVAHHNEVLQVFGHPPQQAAANANAAAPAPAPANDNADDNPYTNYGM